MLEHGGDIKGYVDEFGAEPLDFSANIAPLGVPDAVRQALAACVDKVADYPDPLCRDLVAAIAEKEGLDASCVLCANGCSDVLFRLAIAVKPQRVLLTAPGFSEYEHAFNTVGAHFDYYELRERDRFVVGEDFIERIVPGVDVVLLCQPNNPTGQALSRAFLQRVLQRCEAVQALLVVDECFLGFLDDPAAVTMVPLVSTHENLLVMKAFTKLYGIPGVRLGYALCSNAALLRSLRDYAQPWAVSTMAQAAGVAALSCDEYVARVREIVATERAFLVDELARRGLEGIGQANFLFFSVPGGTFANDMRAQGVLVRDCGNYRGLTNGWYRVAVRTHEENLRLLAAVDAVLAAQ